MDRSRKVLLARIRGLRVRVAAGKDEASESVIPFKERSVRERKLIERYNKKMTTDEWEQSYIEEEVPHWQTVEHHSKLADELVKDLKREGKDEAKILEIGIGSGVDSIFLATAGYEVVGIDVSEAPVEWAKKKARGKRNVTFAVGKAEELEFDDEEFDVVYSVAALHSTLLDDVLTEIHRVLKRGGIVKLFLYTKMRMGKQWAKYWSPAQIKSIAKQAGFKVDKFREGHNEDTIEIPGVEGKVEQESHLVITTLRKPAK